MMIEVGELLLLGNKRREEDAKSPGQNGKEEGAI